MSKSWQSKLLAQFPRLIHGSTSKKFGVIRFGSALPEEVEANRKQIAKELCFDYEKTYLTYQVHGKVVYKIHADQKGNADILPQDLPQADALMTNAPGATLVIQTADCVPVLFYAPSKLVIAAAHAGWEGVSKNIVQEVVSTLQSEYNVDSSEVFCVIGPAICGTCYDVSATKDGRIQLFDDLFDANSEIIVRSNNKVALNLPKANQLQLTKVGVPLEQIEMSEICTYENNQKWASYRRSEKDLDNNVWSFISMVK